MFSCTCPYKFVWVGYPLCLLCESPSIYVFSRWERVKGIENPHAPLDRFAEYYYCVCKYTLSPDSAPFLADEHVTIHA
jgi:hypothetical protein